MKDSVIVFGGGGIWGVAWMSGLIKGLAENGIDLTEARGFIGTSAGSVVSTQIASGRTPDDMYMRQADPAKQPRERVPRNNGMMKLMEAMNRSADTPDARVRAIADVSLHSDTIEISVAERHADIVERLGISENTWPAKSLSLTAIDTATCELMAFTAKSGVGLYDAVAASCAVPGVWPATPINGRLYMDGGLWRNGENAHLARGERSILIVSPFGARGPNTPGSLQSDIEDLRRGGSHVELVAADDRSLASLGGKHPLDPAVRTPAAEAGRAQGRIEADKVRAWIG